MSGRGEFSMFDVMIEQLRSPLLQIHLLSQVDNTAKDVSALTKSLVQLIDNMQLAADIERNQTVLHLEPLNLAELTEEVAHGLTSISARNGIELRVEQLRKAPVLAHREMLARSYQSMAISVMEMAKASERPEVVLKADHFNNKTRLGVYAPELNFYAADLRRLHRLFGKTSRPIAHVSADPAAQLYIADRLLRSMGSRLRTSIAEHRRGLAVSLLPSSQLSLIR